MAGVFAQLGLGSLARQLPPVQSSRHPSWRQDSTTWAGTTHEWSLGFFILSICPSGSPSSLGGLSPPYRIPGLGHPLCGSTLSLPEVSVCLCDLFLLVPFQGHKYQPDDFLPLLPGYVGILLATLAV